MMADYIARLEKQLNAAELRAREAEAGAKDARNAAAEALIERARDQKSATARNGFGSSPAKSELTTLRAELEAARQDLLRHEARLEDAREEAARDLRIEYEQKFHAARERMAQEFQKHLTDARRTLGTNVSRPSPGEDTPHPAASPGRPEHQSPAVAERGSPLAIRRHAVLHFVKDGLTKVNRRPIFAMVAATFAAGFGLGWFALPNRNIEIVGENIAPPAAESTPEETTSVPQIESPPAATAPQPLDVPPPSDDENAAAPETRTAGDEPAETFRPDFPRLAEELRDAQERNAALTQQLDALQLRLDRANRRAGAAESDLRAEREKAADRSRRAIAGNRGRNDQTPDATPLAQQPTSADQASRPISQPPGPASPYPMVE